LVSALILLLSDTDLKTIIHAAFVLMFLILILFYCYHVKKNRFFERLTVSYLSGAICLIVYFINGEWKKTGLLQSVLIAVIVVISLNGFWFRNLKYNNPSYSDKVRQQKEVAAAIREDEDHLYIYQTLDRFWDNDLLFEDIDYLSFENVLSLGEWTTMTPFTVSVMEKYNISNPYQDLIDNDKLYLLMNNDDDTFNMIMDHIRTYHDKNARAAAVKRIGDSYTVYKIVTK
jgi:hypothetical protein